LVTEERLELKRTIPMDHEIAHPAKKAFVGGRSMRLFDFNDLDFNHLDVAELGPEDAIE
jgi:hypothetical protein